MFQLFNEKVDQQIGMIVQNTHQFHELDLANLNYENWSAFFIYSVEAIRAKRLDLLVLLELKVLLNKHEITTMVFQGTYQYGIDVLLFPPA